MAPPFAITSELQLGVPRFAGEDSVTSLAFSPDGTRLLAGEARWTTVWTLAGERVWTAAPGGNPVWLGNERVLVTGFANQPCIFEAASGRRIETTMNANLHNAIGVGPGANLLVHGLMKDGSSGLALLADSGETIAGEGELAPFDHERRLSAIDIPVQLAASTDGRRIAVLRGGKPEDRCLRVVDGGLRPIWSEYWPQLMALDPSGALLAVVTHQTTVVILEGATGHVMETFRLGSAVASMAFSAAGTLAVGFARGGVILLNAATGDEIGTFDPNGHRAREDVLFSVAFSPDGTKLAAGLKQRISIQDIATGREFGSAHERGAPFVAVLGGESVVTRGPDSTRVWALGSGELTNTFAHDFSHEEEIWLPPLAASSGGLLLDACNDGVIRQRLMRQQDARFDAVGWATPTGKPRPKALALCVASARPNRVAAILASGDDVTARVFDLTSGLETGVFAFPRAAGSASKRQADSALALSPDGQLLAVAMRHDGGPGAIHLVSADTGTHLGTVGVEIGATSVDFLEEKTLVFSTGSRGMWTCVVSPQIEAAVEVAPDANHATVSHARTLLASWSAESGSVHLRDVRSLAAEPFVVASGLAVTRLAFSTDERHLVACIQDGSIRVWEISREAPT